MTNGRQEILLEADQVLAAYYAARERVSTLQTYGDAARELCQLAEVEVASLATRLDVLESRAGNYLAAVRKVGA